MKYFARFENMSFLIGLKIGSTLTDVNMMQTWFLMLAILIGLSILDWFPSLIKLHFRYAYNDW